MNSNLDGLYKIREFKQEDLKFVLTTFLNSYYYGNQINKHIPKNIFWEHYSMFFNTALNNNLLNIQIACLEDDEDVILGFSILSPDYLTLHWVYVKQVWRKQKMARSLTPKYIVNITHLSDLGLKLYQQKFPGAIYNPFKI